MLCLSARAPRPPLRPQARPPGGSPLVHIFRPSVLLQPNVLQGHITGNANAVKCDQVRPCSKHKGFCCTAGWTTARAGLRAPGAGHMICSLLLALASTVTRAAIAAAC